MGWGTHLSPWGRVPTLPCCAPQVLWTFSIYLEAVAIIPQLVLLQRTQNIDNLTGNYVFLLGRAAPTLPSFCGRPALRMGMQAPACTLAPVARADACLAPGAMRWAWRRSCSSAPGAAMRRAVGGRLYRALYILNWIYRFFTEPGYRQWIGACHSRARARQSPALSATVTAHWFAS